MANTTAEYTGQLPSLTGGKAAQSVADGKLLQAAIISVAGFLAAILANRFIPQFASITQMAQYSLGPLVIDRNDFYQLVLLGIILIYAAAGLAAWIDNTRRPHYIKRAHFRFAMGIVLAVYDLVATKLQLTPRPFFPGPSEILEAFLNDGSSILQNLLYSLRLFGAGFLFGTVLGVSTGILIGWFPKVYYWLYPVLKITGVIPAVAWMPFALTAFPTAFSAAVFLIVICSWFTVASQTSAGIQSTPKLQFEAARTLGGNTFYLVFHVAVPHAMPQIFTGITTACASSFTCLVMAEMMGQPGGLGYYINIAKVWAAYYKIFAAILVMAILFSLILAILGAVRSYLLRWQRGQFKNE